MELNDRQIEAVTSRTKHTLVVAGPGSGKSQVLIERAKWLITNGALPNTILLLTFTNHAAGEMVDRIAASVSADGILACTFHSFCYRIIRASGRLFTVADDDDQRQILKRIIKGHLLKYAPGVIAERIDICKSRNAPLPAEPIYEMYEKYLSDHNLIDFGGLQVIGLPLMDNVVCYKHIMVDEFHDTSPIQMEIVKSLERYCDTLTVVCDDQQSIYGWRGADINNILEFPRIYTDCNTISLERNYRSTKCIVKSINSLISHATEKLCDKNLYSCREDGVAPIVMRCADPVHEATTLARNIRTIGSYQDHMVLMRTNAQSRYVEDEFMRSGIPYTIIAAVSFYRRKEIKDVMAYLRYIYNDKDEVSLERIINVPVRGIGKTTVNRLISTYGGLVEALGEAHRGSSEVLGARYGNKLLSFMDVVSGLRELSNDTIDIIMRAVLDRTGYMAYLREDTSISGMSRVENVDALLSGAHEFVSRYGKDATLEKYLMVTGLASDSDGVTNSSGVRVMTIHASKGLESRYVHVIGCEEGVIPHVFSDSIEEERRLFYVAVSRAMNVVYITYCTRRMVNGKFAMSSRTRYIGELSG